MHSSANKHEHHVEWALARLPLHRVWVESQHYEMR